MNKKSAALITGWSLVLMTIVAAFCFGYAFSIIYTPEELESISDNLISNRGLYALLLVGISIILVLDLVVSYSVFEYFKDDHKGISKAAGISRFVYTLIFAVAASYLLKNLNYHTESNLTLITNFDNFQKVWDGGLILFGFHVILLGVLMKLHKKVPKILCWITLIGGFSYVIVHILKYVTPGEKCIPTLELILAIPMIAAELGLAIWLIVTGWTKKQKGIMR